MKTYLAAFTGALPAADFAAGLLATEVLAGALAVTPVPDPDFFFLSSAKSCQKTTIGLATNTEEYVPTRIPRTSANEKPCSTGPPNKNKATAVRKVRPEVITVRLSV